jgi:hypothetical protein
LVTIPAVTTADQQDDDDVYSLSSLSSISSHPVLSGPTASEMGPVTSSFWVPPPIIAVASGTNSPAGDSACLPPVPACLLSQIPSPSAKSRAQLPRTPEPSGSGNSKPKLVPLQEVAAEHDSVDKCSGSDCTAAESRKPRSAHAQARDARKAESSAAGQRLVSTTWLAGNLAALDEMQGNLAVPGMQSCAADGSVSSVSQHRPRSTPRSPRARAETGADVTSHAISPQAHQLSTSDSDADVAATDNLRAVPSLHMVSQEPSETGFRAGTGCDMHEAGPSLLSPRRCAREVLTHHPRTSCAGADDVMLPSSPARCSSRKVPKEKTASPTAKSAFRATYQMGSPARCTTSLTRPSKRRVRCLQHSLFAVSLLGPSSQKSSPLTLLLCCVHVLNHVVAKLSALCTACCA